MQDKPEREPTLAEMEEEVLKEGREWTRRRLEQKLQGRADGISQSFSPSGPSAWCDVKKRKLTLESSVGWVEIETDYGQEPGGGRWLCPQREAWAIGAHQKMTPALQERLCFTVIETGSYESAARVATKWGCRVDDSKLHALAQRAGGKAEAQAPERIKTAPPERRPQRQASELGVLLVDGWQVRHRGPGWGEEKAKQNRVEWHEMKLGVYYQTEQAARKSNGRGELAEKVVVSTLEDAVALGQRLNWEALRAGLGRARNLEMLGDGAAWIWNLKDQRWQRAVEVLDFYHSSEHVWALGRALQGEEKAKDWTEPLLHQIRHGQEKRRCGKLPDCKGPKENQQKWCGGSRTTSPVRNIG